VGFLIVSWQQLLWQQLKPLCQSSQAVKVELRISVQHLSHMCDQNERRNCRKNWKRRFVNSKKNVYFKKLHKNSLFSNFKCESSLRIFQLKRLHKAFKNALFQQYPDWYKFAFNIFFAFFDTPTRQ